jgi:hypothetical protein
MFSDYATYKRREGVRWEWAKHSLLSYITDTVVSVFFIFIYYMIPAALIVLSIRWLTGSGIRLDMLGVAYYDAVLKCAYIICLSDNYADFIAPSLKKGKASFFVFILKTFFIFFLIYLLAMVLARGWAQINSENTLIIPTRILFTIHLVPNPVVNLILTIILFLLAGILSYKLAERRHPAP